MYYHSLRVAVPGKAPRYFQKRQSDATVCYRLLAMQDMITEYHRLFGLPRPTFTLDCYQVAEKDLPAEMAAEDAIEDDVANQLINRHDH